MEKQEQFKGGLCTQAIRAQWYLADVLRKSLWGLMWTFADVRRGQSVDG